MKWGRAFTPAPMTLEVNHLQEQNQTAEGEQERIQAKHGRDTSSVGRRSDRGGGRVDTGNKANGYLCNEDNTDQGSDCSTHSFLSQRPQ